MAILNKPWKAPTLPVNRPVIAVNTLITLPNSIFPIEAISFKNNFVCVTNLANPPPLPVRPNISLILI